MEDLHHGHDAPAQRPIEWIKGLENNVLSKKRITFPHSGSYVKVEERG